MPLFFAGRSPPRALSLSLSLSLAAVLGCRPSYTSTAVELEREAERHRMQAEGARAALRSRETTRPMPSATEMPGDPATPVAGYAAGSAAVALDHAEREERAARRIRSLADAACLHVAVETRTSCPLGGPIDRLVIVPPSVRLLWKRAVDIEALRAQLRCAEALWRVEQSPEAATCPLLAPGVTLRLDSDYLELTASDEAGFAELRRRAEIAAR